VNNPATPGQLQPGIQPNAFLTNAVVAQPAGTNQGQGTNLAGGTNQVTTTNQVFVTNQVFSTNFVSITNRVGLATNDQAASEFDRVLIVQVRQRLYHKDPGTSGTWNSVNFASQGGTMLVSGQVLNLSDKESVLVVARNTPGVVQVVDHMLVNPNMNSSATSGTVSRFLNPASDPSLGDSYRFSMQTNRFGQRIFMPPARGTLIATNLSPTGPTNPEATNIVVEGVSGTNVIIVNTNTTP
jgi:hypothetical protein